MADTSVSLVVDPQFVTGDRRYHPRFGLASDWRRHQRWRFGHGCGGGSSPPPSSPGRCSCGLLPSCYWPGGWRTGL